MTLADLQAQLVILDQDAQTVTSDVQATMASSAALKTAQDDLTAKQTQQANDAQKLDTQLQNVKSLLDQYASSNVITAASSPAQAPSAPPAPQTSPST